MAPSFSGGDEQAKRLVAPPGWIDCSTVGEALRVPTTEESPQVDEPMSMRWSIGRVLAVATMLAIALFWTVVFSGLPKRTNPDYLDDRAFVSRTETRCDELLADLDELPNGSFIEDANQRADVLDDATDMVHRLRLVEDMVDATYIEADAPRDGSCWTR
jgi:hypothetical protein